MLPNLVPNPPAIIKAVFSVLFWSTDKTSKTLLSLFTMGINLLIDIHFSK